MSHILPTGSASKPKVAVLGAAGGVGQPLSLLLKLSPLVGELSLYGVTNVVGVATDLSHISTTSKVKGYQGPDQLADALHGCSLVVISAGVTRRPGMTSRNDLLKINASIIQTLCVAIAQHCPNAWVAIITNPVNSTVPIAAEVFKKAGCFHPGRLFGVTTLDLVRAEAFVGEALGVDATTVSVPVVGGHAGITILPLLSQAQPPLHVPEEQLRKLTARIQNGGMEVIQAKGGVGTSTLSMGHAGARFVTSCLRALGGESGVEDYAYVASSVVPGVDFFSSRLRLGQDGVQEVLGLGPLSPMEEEGLLAMKAELVSNIQSAVEFAAST